MSDGYPTPAAHDGMATFNVKGELRLLRNHEINGGVGRDGAAFGDAALAYDPKAGGGVTTLIIDPKTRELKSYITQILEEGKLMMREAVKAELHQSMIEVGTEICRTPQEARSEIVRLRKGVMELAGKHGLKIAAAGTHPFSSWIENACGRPGCFRTPHNTPGTTAGVA